MHLIDLEESYKNNMECQRSLNPNIKVVVKKEVIKWLDASIIYPIYNSMWVSHIQCVPMRGRMTAIENEKKELIASRVVIR